MSRPKKFSIDDWWEGEIVLNTSPYETYNGVSPTVASWNEIKASDIERIKSNQKLLFKGMVKPLLLDLQNNFKELIELVPSNPQFYKEEITLLHQVIYNNVSAFKPDDELIWMENWRRGYTAYELREIQSYTRRPIRNFDFIHSPNCLFQSEKKPLIEALGQSLIDYYKWLIEYGKEYGVNSLLNSRLHTW